MKRKVLGIIVLILSTALLVATIIIGGFYNHLLPKGNARSNLLALFIFLFGGGISAGASLMLIGTTKTEELEKNKEQI